ncbi:MAG: hypothetical protein MUC29_01650 [Pyrinomonadaceae bacterium]|jgi:hypothetical protein|nr:hypothetical protein [Pyrinomonadaceae bacterium]
MSQVIELKDEVYTKLKANADKRGVTPEVWIEIIVEERKNDLGLLNISDKERNQLNEFHNRVEKTIKDGWKRKLKKELSSVNE